MNNIELYTCISGLLGFLLLYLSLKASNSKYFYNKYTDFVQIVVSVFLLLLCAISFSLFFIFLGTLLGN